MLPRIHQGNKILSITVGYGIFCVFYVGAQLNLFQDPVAPPALELDQQLPFLPESVWLYNSQFVFMASTLWFTRDDERLDRACYGILLGTVLAFLIFSVYPTEMPSRPIIDGQGLTAMLWQALYSVDKPSNCMPSLHCCLALIGALSISSRGRLFTVGAGLWAGAIAFSTLVTKQHVVLDVLAGLSLGLLSYLLVAVLRGRAIELKKEVSLE